MKGFGYVVSLAMAAVAEAATASALTAAASIELLLMMMYVCEIYLKVSLIFPYIPLGF